MTDRVTPAEVLSIISTTFTDIAAFITAANLIVTNSLGASALNAATLKEIERWLSAHMIATADPRATEEATLDANIKYQTQVGLGLDLTSYGQQVKVLDTTGILASVGKVEAKMEVVEQVTWSTS